MKRSPWIIVAALVGFAAILIARLPASWVIPSGPKAAAGCASLEGTLWSGACGGLRIEQQSLGDLSWELQPLRLLSGRLAARVVVTRAASHASADVELGLGGHWSARNLQSDLTLDPKLLPGLPATLHGTARIDLARVEFTHGALTQLQGRIEAHDLEDRSGNVTPLGSYVVTFPGGEGEPVGQLHDLGGPLSVEGTLKLTRPGGYEVQGMLAPRPGAPPELLSNLRFLGSPDASGRRPFGWSGTF